MRDSLSCEVRIRHFGVWRAAVGVVFAAALAVLVAWVVAAPAGRPAVWIAGVAGAAMGMLLLAASLLRVDSGRLLRHDRHWSFAAADADGGAPKQGELAVAVDLGSFMLLFFTGHDAAAAPVRRWLAAQRRGLEHDRHALRRAAYAPPPAAAAALGADEPLAE